MTRRKDGLYQQKITINGKTKYIYGKTKADILRKMTEYKTEVAESPLFSTVADAWWSEHEATLAAQSVRPYKAAYERAVLAFGQIRIAKIEPFDVSRQIIAFGKDHADKTTRTQLMIYNLIFRYAVLQGYITVNPAREVQIPKNLRKTKRVSASEEDIAKIKAAVDLPFGLFAYMAMYTGLRKGELLALTWDDIDLKNGVISVSKSIEHIHHQPNIKSPKTTAGTRTVVIPSALLKALEMYKKKSGKILFPAASGNYMGDTQFLRAWKAYSKGADISCTPHQLRHVYATGLFEADINIKDAQYLLGHAQYSTTMDIYTDFRASREKHLRDKLKDFDIS